MAEWKQVIPAFLGDYYPLTPYSLTGDVWMAWQFDRPEQGEGVVEAFRRADSVYETARFRLSGLDPDARYTLTDLDTQKTAETTGGELMSKGLAVTIGDQPGSAIVTYKRK
jgi:alpha-galactosidase